MAPRDFQNTDFDRELYRTTSVGEIPVGENGEKLKAVSGTPLEAV